MPAALPRAMPRAHRAAPEHPAHPAPLLLCGLCCWPDDHSSDTSSGKYSRKSTIDNDATRHTSDVLPRRRPHASAISLHLPGTSGIKELLSSHRSHEEIRSRRKSHHTLEPDTARYFSAPSVIDQVIHRRDWNRSTKELHIPLNPTEDDLLRSNNPNDIYIPLKSKYDIDSEDDSPKAPLAINESLSGDNLQEKQCKKHHTNIKCSRRDKESNSEDVKDVDATENFTIYIGELRDETLIGLNRTDSLGTLVNKLSPEGDENLELDAIKVCTIKDEKQCLNESIKSKERSRGNSVSECDYQPLSCGQAMAHIARELSEPDRSGAMHRTESSISLATSIARSLPCAPSVEPIAYSALGCGSPRSRLSALLSDAIAGGVRPRHASDGDILAPTHRPDSGAFSESDLELELDMDEPPPPYSALPPPRAASAHAPRPAARAAHPARTARRETAI